MEALQEANGAGSCLLPFSERGGMSNSDFSKLTAIPSTHDLRSLWGQSFSRKDDDYDVRQSVGEHLIAVSRDAHPTLIVRVANFRAHAGLVVGKVRLKFLGSARLEIDGKTEHADVAAFECLDQKVVDTFAALVSDLLDEIGVEASSPAEILKAFGQWHDLLATRERMSSDVEQGLWGELALLELAPDIDDAEAAWNGPKKGVVDFLRGNVGLEVKTGRRRRRHTISFDQALFGVLDHDVYLVSLWVQPNEDGATLPELIERIAAQVTDEARFRKKVIGLGYRAEHADQYGTRLCLVEAPVAFPMHVVPRIENVPTGVLNVRWDIDLSSRTHTDESDLEPLLAKISGVSE